MLSIFIQKNFFKYVKSKGSPKKFDKPFMIIINNFGDNAELKFQQFNARPMILPARSDFPKLAVRFVRDNIQSAVATLTHVANALSAICEQMFFADDSIVFDDQPHKAL